MANCCFDYLECVSKNKEELIRLSKILERKDPEYATGLFDGYSEDIIEEDGYYTMQVNGWTKWSIAPLVGCDETYDGIRYVDLPFLLEKVLPNTAVEVLAEECGCNYAGWMICYNGGEYRTDSTDYMDAFVENIEEAGDLLRNCVEDGMISKDVAGHALNELKDMDCRNGSLTASLLISGYEFEFGKPDEIFKGTSCPVERKEVEIIS